MKYRSEIDGLRAVAVLPVILYHAGLSAFSGGFLGVDVFFVISGYLITTIIISDLEKGQFTISKFYERRIRRIIPALFFVMICCMPFAYILLYPADFKEFSESIIATVFFSSNIYFWTKIGYFQAAAELKPLLHTWSLAIEEQFYLFFPIFLMIGWRYFKNYIYTLILIATVVSFSLCVWMSTSHTGINFFLLPTRWWELAIGCISAFILFENTPLYHQKLSSFLATLGLICIILPIFYIDKDTPWPSVYTMAPVIGTSFIILFAKDTFIARLLSIPLIVGIGLISYSAYLWHYPIFAFARILGYGQNYYLMAALSLATLCLAYFSWLVIETPFRKKLSRTKVYIPALSISILCLAFGSYGFLTKGADYRFSKEELMVLNAKGDTNPYRPECHYYPGNELPSYPQKGCLKKSDLLTVYILGDSHADAIAAPIRHALDKTDIGYYEYTASSCIGLQGFYKLRLEEHKLACNDYFKDALRRIDPQKSVLILLSRWTMYLNGDRFTNSLHITEAGESPAIDLTQYMGEEITDDQIRQARVAKAYRDKIEELLKTYIVILVYPVPEAGFNVPDYALEQIKEGKFSGELSTSYDLFLKRNKKVLDIFDSLQNPHLFKVKPHKILCDSFIKGRCANIYDNKVFYYDDDHLSVEGAKLLEPEIMKHIKYIETTLINPEFKSGIAFERK